MSMYYSRPAPTGGRRYNKERFPWSNTKGKRLGPKASTGSSLAAETITTVFVMSERENILTNELAGTRYRR